MIAQQQNKTQFHPLFTKREIHRSICDNNQYYIYGSFWALQGNIFYWNITWTCVKKHHNSSHKSSIILSNLFLYFLWVKKCEMAFKQKTFFLRHKFSEEASVKKQTRKLFFSRKCVLNGPKVRPFQSFQRILNCVFATRFVFPTLLLISSLFFACQTITIFPFRPSSFFWGSHLAEFQASHASVPHSALPLSSHITLKLH